MSSSFFFGFRRRCFILALSAIPVCALAGNAAAAVTLINGGFDTDAAGWTGTGNWWHYVVDGNGLAALEADDLAPYFSASGGAAATQAEVFVTVTGLTVDGSYDISFDSGYVSGYYTSGTPEPLLTLNPGGFQVLLNNSLLGDKVDAAAIQLIDPAAPGTYGSLGGVFSRTTVNFIAPSESITLGWRAMEGVMSGPDFPDITNALILLDNITITPVPEPAAPLLACLAAATLIGNRHRSQRNRPATV